MAPTDNNNEFLLALLILVLLADDPGSYVFLEYLEYLEDFERDFVRLVERSPRLKRALPFPPHFLLRRFIDRRQRAYRAFERVSDESERVSARLDRLEQSQNELENKISKDSNEIKASLSQLSSILAEAIWAQSIGAGIHEVKMNRNIPIRCYLADENVISAVGDTLIRSIFESLSEIGIEESIELPAEDGSWWKQAWGRTKETMSQKEVVERLEKLEHAASLKLIDKPQADVTKSNAEAASKMIKALDGVQSACIQIGNLLIVKSTPKKGDARLIIRTLTSSELIALERNKAILKFPGKVIDMLDKECLRLQPPN